MSNKIYPLKELEIPIAIIKRDGPFDEFKQDASFVTVQLNNDEVINGVLLLYPNYVIAIEGYDDLIFNPIDTSKVYQTEDDLNKRSQSTLSFFYDPSEFK